MLNNGVEIMLNPHQKHAQYRRTFSVHMFHLCRDVSSSHILNPTSSVVCTYKGVAHHPCSHIQRPFMSTCVSEERSLLPPVRQMLACSHLWRYFDVESVSLVLNLDSLTFIQPEKVP